MEPKLSAEQIQSAIERAQISVTNLADHAGCPPDSFDADCKFRLQLEDAQALLDVYGRLQEAKKRAPITNKHWRAVVELSAYATDAAKQWSAEAEQLRAELTEARTSTRQTQMERDNYASQLTLSNKWLGEASRQLDIARKAIEIFASRSFVTDLTDADVMAEYWARVQVARQILSQITPTETRP